MLSADQNTRKDFAWISSLSIFSTKFNMVLILVYKKRRVVHQAMKSMKITSPFRFTRVYIDIITKYLKHTEHMIEMK